MVHVKRFGHEGRAAVSRVRGLERGDAKVMEVSLRGDTPEFMRRFILKPCAFSGVAGIDEKMVVGSALKNDALCYVAPFVRFKAR